MQIKLVCLLATLLSPSVLFESLLFKIPIIEEKWDHRIVSCCRQVNLYTILEKNLISEFYRKFFVPVTSVVELPMLLTRSLRLNVPDRTLKAFGGADV